MAKFYLVLGLSLGVSLFNIASFLLLYFCASYFLNFFQIDLFYCFRLMLFILFISLIFGFFASALNHFKFSVSSVQTIVSVYSWILLVEIMNSRDNIYLKYFSFVNPIRFIKNTLTFSFQNMTALINFFAIGTVLLLAGIYATAKLKIIPLEQR